MILLSDTQLLAHGKERGAAFPFSLTGLRHDRIDGRLGGVPFRKVGGRVFYTPADVDAFLAGLPIHQPNTSIQLKKNGTSTKAERVEAARFGITVRELRQRKGGE